MPWHQEQSPTGTGIPAALGGAGSLTGVRMGMEIRIGMHIGTETRMGMGIGIWTRMGMGGGWG